MALSKILAKDVERPSGQDIDDYVDARELAIIDKIMPLGKLEFLDSYSAPSETNPRLCLDAINGSEDISDSNWPDLVPHFRGKLLKVKEGTAGEKSQFDVTAWDITSNVATLTFANATAEQAILDDLLEDNNVHGSFGSWRAIRLPSAIGDIAAGTYAITAVDTVSRQIEFSYTSADNSGSVTAVAEFPAHEVPGSSTTARVFQVSGRSVVSANDGDDEVISGLRRRDQMQGHHHIWENDEGNNRVSWNPGSNAADAGSGSRIERSHGFVRDPITDGTNGTPRTGTHTDPRSIGAHLYIWARRYVA